MFCISFRKFDDQKRKTTCLLWSSKCKFHLPVSSLRQQLVLVLISVSIELQKPIKPISLHIFFGLFSKSLLNLFVKKMVNSVSF